MLKIVDYLKSSLGGFLAKPKSDVEDSVAKTAAENGNESNDAEHSDLKTEEHSSSKNQPHKIGEVIDKAVRVATEGLKNIKNEYQSIREKSKDLAKTNYDLALRHLDRGNVSEAIFRLKIVKKFWPNYYQAYYKLAYCLTLKEKYEQAQEVLQELLILTPESKKSIDELISLIDEQSKIKD